MGWNEWFVVSDSLLLKNSPLEITFRVLKTLIGS